MNKVKKLQKVISQTILLANNDFFIITMNVAFLLAVLVSNRRK